MSDVWYKKFSSLFETFLDSIVLHGVRFITHFFRAVPPFYKTINK